MTTNQEFVLYLLVGWAIGSMLGAAVILVLEWLDMRRGL